MEDRAKEPRYLDVASERRMPITHQPSSTLEASKSNCFFFIWEKMESGPCREPGMVKTRSRSRAGQAKWRTTEEALASLRRVRAVEGISAAGPSAAGAVQSSQSWRWSI